MYIRVDITILFYMFLIHLYIINSFIYVKVSIAQLTYDRTNTNQDMKEDKHNFNLRR